MRKCLAVICTMILLLSCSNKKEAGRFTVSGEIKNVEDQQIYLDQLYFSRKDPEVLDTTAIKNGKFSLTAIAPEEGMFRIRLEKGPGFIFINDQPAISFKGDMKDMSLTGPDFNSPANRLLKQFLIDLEAKRNPLIECSTILENLKKNNGSDSAIAAEMTKLTDLNSSYENFIIHYMDSSSNPVMAMFTLGFTQTIDPAKLKDAIPGLAKRFPNHQGIAAIVTQYNQLLAMQNQPQQGAGIQPGTFAPEITLNDVNNKPFSLSQLKGKYVLVDFWASWCGPCRRENPNVVAAYNKYKDKNFTVLGVSLDDDKAAWLKAIKDDSLTWMHISDLRQWNSDVVASYGFDGIPYNVLIDPKGVVIATSLRDDDLEKKLSEILE